MALLSVAILLIGEKAILSEMNRKLLVILDNVIYLVFIVDYVWGLWKAKSKTNYARSHIIELVAILPFNSMLKGVRALRLLRVLRVARLLAYFARACRFLLKFLERHNFQYVIMLTMTIVLTGAVAIRYFEKLSFGEALWWSFVTTTTVGYGDISPGSTEGRVVASILMLAGIGFISILTGTIASYFVAPTDPLEKQTSKNEYVQVAIRKLERFEELTEAELEEVFAVLTSLKKHS